MGFSGLSAPKRRGSREHQLLALDPTVCSHHPWRKTEPGKGYAALPQPCQGYLLPDPGPSASFRCLRKGAVLGSPFAAFAALMSPLTFPSFEA